MADENAEVVNQNAVTLGTTSGWSSHPRAWFQQTEAQFALRYITVDISKYCCVVAVFVQNTAQHSLNLLENPPVDSQCNAFKQRLLQTFALSQQECAARILNLTEFGNRKPTALMDDMLALMRDHRPCFLGTYVFLQLLPEDIIH